jgi:hypothetical protein
MILNQNNINQYLQDYHAGLITKGKDVGVSELDSVLRFKEGQLTIINGLDNVGKTIWMLWYYLALSYKHNLKWIIYSGENKAGQLVRQLIQFMTGKRLEQMELKDVFQAELKIQQWFTFIDNSNFYKSTELFKIFADNDYNGCLIDPFTGMNREYTHAANYDFLNECRSFCNSTNKSVYVNTHVVSEAARRTYPENHEFSGYPFPPSKSQSEGGQPFGNRTDDFITIHRLVGHPLMQYKTLLYIRKIKDTETGGMVTPIDEPLHFDFNAGLGFTINGKNPLNPTVKDDLALSVLSINSNFEEETPF